jgi:hypothetical protein
MKMKYHHLGIPTTVPQKNEKYLEKFRTHVAGYETSPYGIEWMRYEADAPVPDLVKSVPHIAFEVDDLLEAITGKEILIPPNSPSEGVTVAFIVDNCAPVEFIQFDKGYEGKRAPDPH